MSDQRQSRISLKSHQVVVRGYEIHMYSLAEAQLRALHSGSPYTSLLGSQKQCGHHTHSVLKVAFATSVGLGLQGLALHQATNAVFI